MFTKTDLRKQHLAIRSSYSSEYRSEVSGLIYQKIVHIPQFFQASTICCYISHDTEIDTHRIIEQSLKLDKRIVVPRVKANLLTLHEIQSLQECTPGFKTILEPPEDNPIINPTEVDIFIILGLAFDTFKYRIGYGKGHTDRLLAGLQGFKIGLSFTDQLVYEIPHEPHDIPLDTIITDSISIM
jgi:5-formyltetrahydrofolate cyclo-ligase